jgi:phthalate 4,5-cis-dihydrodiol dehydrogenase
MQDLAHQNFGTLLVSCEQGDLRALPGGVVIYRDGSAQLDALPAPKIPRVEVIDELYGAVVRGRPPLHDGAWAMATLEVLLAILQSARKKSEVRLSHQVGK